jgi:hypothetical protein
MDLLDLRYEINRIMGMWRGKGCDKGIRSTSLARLSSALAISSDKRGYPGSQVVFFEPYQRLLVVSKRAFL